MKMTLQYVRGISYSQLYKEDADTVDNLLQNLPTSESVIWLSYILHQKVTMTIDQTEYDILMPLLFQLNPELQHKILEFIGPVANTTDYFLDKPALLKTIEELLYRQNSIRRDLTREDKSRLFKAYLIACDECLAQDGLINRNGMYTAEDMLQCYMPYGLKLNNVLSIKDPLIEFVKSKLFLVDFASNDKLFAQLVENYIRDRKFQSASYYMSSLLELAKVLICNSKRTNMLEIGDSKNNSLYNFLDNFCVNINNKTVCTNIQEKPLYKVDKDTYCVLYLKFFVDKFFHSLLFDIANVCEKRGILNLLKGPAYVQLKQLVGQKFTEQYLFYGVIGRVLTDSKYQKMTGDDMLNKYGQGFPDYYARKAKRIFLFEFKGVQLKDRVVKSGDFKTIIDAIENAFVKNDRGKPKGITQLANNIESHLDKRLGVDNETDNWSVYPILVYTDSGLDIEGFNYYLNNRFRQLLEQKHIGKNIIIKDLVLVNIDTLIMFEKAFVDKKIKFDVLLNEYISYKDSKEQYKVVPFNKFLFHKCWQKGYFYKASYLVKDMINDMIEREKKVSLVL